MQISLSISRWALIALTVALLTSCGDQIPSKPSFKNQTDSISYFIGTMYGGQMQGIEINYGLLARGMMDAADSSEVAFTEEEKQALFLSVREAMFKKQQETAEAASGPNREAGAKFLEANKAKEGVKVLENGLQYKVLKSGTGASPLDTNTVRVHYVGKFISGEVFDSSVDRGEPAEFKVNQVIPGWTQILQMMKPGDKWEVFIPYDLGYGPQGYGDIPPFATLTFEIELLEILK